LPYEEEEDSRGFRLDRWAAGARMGLFALFPFFFCSEIAPSLLFFLQHSFRKIKEIGLKEIPKHISKPFKFPKTAKTFLLL
jgi:hypothetical protein